MHRVKNITLQLTTLALIGAVALPCAAQVANGGAQVEAVTPTAADPFQLEAPPAPSTAPLASPPAEIAIPEAQPMPAAIPPDAEVVPTNAVAPLTQPALPRLAPRNEAAAAAPLAKSADSSTLVTVGGSLTLVVGLFLLVTWCFRRGTPSGSSLLPREAVEMLGRAPLPGRQQMHLVRVGRKLLLVNVTPNGAETLTEITDPLEVDRLVGICQQRKPNSSTAAFHSVLEDLSRYGDRDEIELDDDRSALGRRSARGARGQGGAHA